MNTKIANLLEQLNLEQFDISEEHGSAAGAYRYLVANSDRVNVQTAHLQLEEFDEHHSLRITMHDFEDDPETGGVISCEALVLVLRNEIQAVLCFASGDGREALAKILLQA